MNAPTPDAEVVRLLADEQAQHALRRAHVSHPVSWCANPACLWEQSWPAGYLPLMSDEERAYYSHVAVALAKRLSQAQAPTDAREALARAWDEGEQAGRDDADAGYPDPQPENPYRAALSPTPPPTRTRPTH